MHLGKLLSTFCILKEDRKRHPSLATPQLIVSAFQSFSDTPYSIPHQILLYLLSKCTLNLTNIHIQTMTYQSDLTLYFLLHIHPFKSCVLNIVFSTIWQINHLHPLPCFSYTTALMQDTITSHINCYNSLFVILLTYIL